ncbi:nucleoside deaminase [Amnibacterium kyonggiense]|uniref:tRNA-specific adenosine deaminase n=1 Tax=Amnibacterium kyonggiense TaxID=595671 RepID=A0A4R7FPI9_9MICO|nr:nucleoside deaminase [Amnibacterium kyonggiense]TDS79662.1 tRNA-adenosine deaminase [Amnibacterium kyonggiense]
MATDADAMGLALAEAALAPATGDVPVGAVVLAADGTVLGRGHNLREAQGDPLAHAEVVALRDAARAAGGWRLDGATLVVTLEPCVMCAGALLAARVGRLVYGAWDEKAGAVGSVLDVVRDRRPSTGVEVVAGVRAEEAAALLRAFFLERRPGSGPGVTPSRG